MHPAACLLQWKHLCQSIFSLLSDRVLIVHPHRMVDLSPSVAPLSDKQLKCRPIQVFKVASEIILVLCLCINILVQKRSSLNVALPSSILVLWTISISDRPAESDCPWVKRNLASSGQIRFGIRNITPERVNDLRGGKSADKIAHSRHSRFQEGNKFTRTLCHLDHPAALARVQCDAHTRQELYLIFTQIHISVVSFMSSLIRS